jgi:hypothetical protein
MHGTDFHLAQQFVRKLKSGFHQSQISRKLGFLSIAGVGHKLVSKAASFKFRSMPLPVNHAEDTNPSHQTVVLA